MNEKQLAKIKKGCILILSTAFSANRFSVPPDRIQEDPLDGMVAQRSACSLTTSKTTRGRFSQEEFHGDAKHTPSGYCKACQQTFDSADGQWHRNKPRIPNHRGEPFTSCQTRRTHASDTSEADYQSGSSRNAGGVSQSVPCS